MARIKIFFFVTVVFFLLTENSRSQNESHPINLSLKEAILLATRDNPNIQTTQLSYVLQKFNLFVQEWQFYPHYSLQASATLNRSGTPGQPISNSHTYSVQPGVSLLTPIGTQIALNAPNTKTGHYNPSVSTQITQPLMRGFGRAIVEAALKNAMDADVIARLTIEDTLRITITDVINAYLDIVAANEAIHIDEKALDRAILSVKQTKLYIKGGHKAGNELVTVEANVASARSTLENDKNNLAQKQYALLAAIGIDPNQPVHFVGLNIQELINKYHLPSLDQAKKLILANNISYQTAQITLNGSTTRNLIIAADNTRWQLNLTANATTGNGSGGGQNAGVDSIFNGANQSQSIGLQLQIPIDDQISKQALLNAQIALKQAKIALKKQKWDIETNAINGWNNVVSAERALRFAENAEKLQEKTYQISYQKYLHGLIDSLELQTAQVQLIQEQQNLLSNQIAYLKSLVNLDWLIGHTLKTWGITVRLSS
jgi:outer membrane protein